MAEMTYKVESKDIPQIKHLLQQVFGGEGYEDINRLGGMTNRSYKVLRNNDEIVVVRIPGEGTEKMIDRVAEKRSNELACSLGLDAKMLYFDDKGHKVMDFIPHQHELNERDMKSEALIEQIADVFHRLHTCGQDTQIPFEIFDMASSYEKIIRANNVALFNDYEDVKDEVMGIKSAEDKKGLGKKVPCHNDPLIANWIKADNGQLFLLDWEYAGMNDYMWDLSCVSLECNYTEKEDTALLTAYYNCAVTAEVQRHFMAEKVYVDFLWTLWGLTRVPYEGEFMEEYAAGRYNRMKENLAAYAKI